MNDSPLDSIGHDSVPFVSKGPNIKITQGSQPRMSMKQRLSRTKYALRKQQTRLEYEARGSSGNLQGSYGYMRGSFGQTP